MNEESSLGSEIVRLESSIPDLEKQARKTPPKTLEAEQFKVKKAKVMLVRTNERLAIAKERLKEVKEELAKMPIPALSFPPTRPRIVRFVIDDKTSGAVVGVHRNSTGLTRPLTNEEAEHHFITMYDNFSTPPVMEEMSLEEWQMRHQKESW